MMTMHYVVVTDAKMDDAGAVALLIMSLARKGDEANIKFVITDIEDMSGGRHLLDTIVNDIMERHKITNIHHEFSRGIAHEGAQKHEKGMFSVFGKGDEGATWTDAFSWVGVHDTTNYIFAPFRVKPDTGLEKIIFDQGAKETFISYGYNSNSSGTTLDDFKLMKNLSIMNNCSETIYPKVDGERVEGGRFKQDDHEVWGALEKVTPILVRLKSSALDDSKKFALKYTTKAFEKLNIDFPLTFDNLMTEEVQKLAQGIDKNALEPYLFRSVDQVARGVLDVEMTDCQHIALWLSGDKVGMVRLDEGAKFLNFVEDKVEGFAKCPVGLTLEDVRQAVIGLCAPLK